VWGWLLTINSHGVEISITVCVEEMVRDTNPKPLFFVYFFRLFLYFDLLYYVCIVPVQELACSVRKRSEGGPSWS